MSQINLKRFVDVDIIYHTLSATQSTRDTVVLLSAEGSTEIDGVYSNLQEIYAAFASATDYAKTRAYAKVYFENGGVKLHVISAIANKAAAEAKIATLPNEQIVIAYTGTYADAKLIAQARETSTTAYGINQKIILGCTSLSTDADSVKNFAVKYASSTVVGAEMTIAAYLSQIDVYKDASIKDYAFTKEVLAEETADDAVLGDCITNNMNVDMYLSGAVRNLGGNMKDGYAVTNAYCLIVLHQTITDRLLSVLVEKLKGSEGLAKIGTVIGQELSRYTSSGFLTTDKVWSDNNLVKTYNDQSFTVIRKGEQLLLGYKVVVLPFTSISDVDKQARKTPPIYVVLADAYGIRAITVNGEVI